MNIHQFHIILTKLVLTLTFAFAFEVFSLQPIHGTHLSARNVIDSHSQFCLKQNLCQCTFLSTKTAENTLHKPSQPIHQKRSSVSLENSSFTIAGLNIECQSHNSFIEIDGKSQCEMGRVVLLLEQQNSSPFASSGFLLFCNTTLAHAGLPHELSSSLVCASGNSHTRFKGCSFHALSHLHPHPFLVCGAASSLSLSDCVFSNITSPAHASTQQHPNPCFGSCDVASCVCDVATDPLFSIFPLYLTSHSFRSFNSSFSRISNNKITNRTVIESSDEEEIVFEDDEFEVSETAYDGGALYVNDANKLIIERCRFSHCSSQHYGGVLYANNIKTLQISKCNFFNCSAGVDAGSFRVYGSESVLIENCLCSECHSNSHYGCGAIFDSKISVLCSNNSFSHSYAKGDAGGLIIRNTNIHTIITSCMFNNLTASWCGSAYVFHQVTSPVAPQSRFLFFMNNTCTDQYSGADFGCCEGWDGVVNSTHFEHCYSLSTGIRSFVCTAGFRPCTAGYEADFIRAPTYSTIHVAQPARASGGDTPHCGELGSECATIAHALTRLAPPAPDASDAPQPIAVLPGSYQEPGVAVAQTHIRISSKDPASPAEVRCNTTGAVLFATASGALELAQLVLVADWGVCPATPLLVLDGDEGAVAVAECTITGAGHSAANRFRSPVVVLRRGAGRITRCTVTALVLDSACAIWVGRRCAAAVECTVCAHIVRSSGCGGAIVLEEEEEDGDSSASASANTNEGDAAQAISGCVFEDCCAEGDGSGGGAICARLRGRGCFTVNASASSGCTLPLVRHHSHNSNTTRAPRGTNGGDDGSGGEALFSRCKSSGYGGAVYLDLAEGFGTLLLDGVVFGGCEAALGGANVFVNGCALTPAEISTSTFCFPFDQSSADDLVGVDRALPEVAPFTLAVFLVPFPCAAHVAGQSSRASNTPFCGFSFFPCLTIPHAARTRFPAADPAILLDEGFQLCERLAADAHAWSISCVRKGMEVPVGAPPGFSSPSLVAVSTEAAIADIRFAVPASLGSATALVEVAGAGSLQMASCSAVHKRDGATAPGDGSEEQLTFALIAVRSGRLVLSEFETLGEVASTMFSLMECTGSSSVVECSGCVIGGGEKGSGDGGCVKMAGVGGGGARLEMENCTVARCSARGSEARGGGVAAELAAGAALLINGSTFEDCAAAAAAGGGQAQTHGLGGAVFVGEADAARLFALEHVVFARCDAWKGRKVFVSATVLSAVADAAHFNWAMTSADLSTLDELGGFELATADPSRPIPLAVYFWTNITTHVFVDGDTGFDFSACGHSAAPCLTIPRALSLRLTPLPLPSSTLSIASHSSIPEPLVLLLPPAPTSPSPTSLPSLRLHGCAPDTPVHISDPTPSQSDALLASSVDLAVDAISFLLPSAFPHHSSFILTSAPDAALLLQRCSFSMLTPQTPLAYVIVLAAQGRVSLDHCTLASVSLSRPFLEIYDASTSAALTSLSVSSSLLAGAPLVAIYPPALAASTGLAGLAGLAAPDPRTAIVLDSANITNIVRTGNGPALVCAERGCAIDCAAEACVLTSCVSEESAEGGAAMVCLDCDKSQLRVSACILTQCICSRTAGRGGGLFLDCSRPARALPIPLSILNLRFALNDAFRGKDLFLRCSSIPAQINESLFSLDFTQPSLATNTSICGSDSSPTDPDLDVDLDVDLLPFITFYRAHQIFVDQDTGSSARQCGSLLAPCASLSTAVLHIAPSIGNILWICSSSSVDAPTSLADIRVESVSASLVPVHFATPIPISSDLSSDRSAVVAFLNTCILTHCHFSFHTSFASAHSSLFSLLDGSLTVSSSLFSAADQPVKLNSTLLCACRGTLRLSNISVHSLHLACPALRALPASSLFLSHANLSALSAASPVLLLDDGSSCSIEHLIATDLAVTTGSVVLLNPPANPPSSSSSSSSFESDQPEGSFSMMHSIFTAISLAQLGCSVCQCNHTTAPVYLANCTIAQSGAPSALGRAALFSHCPSVTLEACSINGGAPQPPQASTSNSPDTITSSSSSRVTIEPDASDAPESVCEWNASLIHCQSTTAVLKDTTISGAQLGALSAAAGSIRVDRCEFANNSPAIPNYPSARRNIICSDACTLTIPSLWPGDPFLPASSLWLLNRGCTLHGIPAHHPSPLFVPVLHSVQANHTPDAMALTFSGLLLAPCNLSFAVVKSNGEEKEIEKHNFDPDGFLSETEAEGSVAKDLVSSCGDEIEVSVCILFGDADRPSSTDSFILKNRSVPKANGDERVVEGGKEEKSYWLLVVIMLVVMFLIVFIGFIMFVVRWRKVKNEAEDLREIVNDNIRKDPKAVEMVTMEMSPEEQWRRAEREAEKKNEERMKKRVYEKSLGHSESSEHLLSESGSTEYILGKDSDKIPEWVLEKVDDEEETRKRTPSPSISSTSTTDTSDTESTFVRGEDLCPTTSSMSNLVDAMACSSPHEKLIVDLRDSMFMLLHGRNKTKEMAIGTLQERQMTAAQILFWVANLALHSFDEMINPLQSLTNLSPHVVLFSEHMVICIALHSDCSSSDSDSSSISSSTVVTSTSDDDRDSLPSSAFEDEDDYKKECLRWKAPELLSGAKSHATKKTVVFSIGMMVWECLTLQIPFAEYEAEAAGRKIANGERPAPCTSHDIPLAHTACAATSQQPHARPTLLDLKKAFIALFPPASAMITASDAIDLLDPTAVPPPSALPASAVSQALTSF